MYKGELKKRYNEEQQIVYVQGFEKGISHVHSQFLIRLERIKLSEKDKYAIIQALNESDNETMSILNFGLDIDCSDK